ncbi:MAG: hypothetical protein LBK99_14270 [Opitutaceae bacterium]|nr:hypothetical protein [Opitutaceae bacterium]
MKSKSEEDPLLTASEVATLLGITWYRLDRLVVAGRLTPIPRPGLKNPGYQKSEVLALKKEFYPGGGGTMI